MIKLFGAGPRSALFLLAALSSTGALGMVHSEVSVGKASEADVRFALDLHGRLRSTPGNLAYSPFSISTALGMTMAGAKGETLAEMGKVLHRPGDDPATQHSFGELVAGVNAGGQSGHVKLLTANALFPQQGETVAPDYLDLVRRTYGGLVEPLDYAKATDAARARINSWVEEKTAEKIKNLIGPGVLSPSTTFVLVNAVYFKGEWEEPFDASVTLSMPFTHASGGRVLGTTMHQTASPVVLVSQEI